MCVNVDGEGQSLPLPCRSPASALPAQIACRTCLHHLGHPLLQVALMLNLAAPALRSHTLLSPRCPVQCAWSQRASLGIPLNATSFAWAYPLLLGVIPMRAAETELFCFLAYGGLIYFDAVSTVVKINAVKQRAPGGPGLTLTGPHAVTSSADLAAYGRLGARLSRVPFANVRTYASRFAWVLPNEFQDCAHGGLLFAYEDMRETRLMKLRPPVSSHGGTSDPLAAAAADLGVQLEFVSQQLHVLSVSSNSPLRACGIGRGDVILQWDERIITGAGEFARAYEDARPGKAITLRVRHPDSRDNITSVFFCMAAPQWAETHADAPEPLGRHLPNNTDAPRCRLSSEFSSSSANSSPTSMDSIDLPDLEVWYG